MSQRLCVPIHDPKLDSKDRPAPLTLTPNPGPENIGPWEPRALGTLAPLACRIITMLICQTQGPGNKEHWEHGADLLANHASK